MNRAELRALLGPPSPEAAQRERPRLDEAARALVARSPLFVLATAGADGSLDASPRGGHAGFVRVLDDARLAWGELPGSRRADSLGNAADNPRAALLFLVPGEHETLRAAGRLELSTDPELLALVALDGIQPVLAAVLHVEQVFRHRGKALRLAGLW